MRVPARAVASVVWMVVVAALAGCSTARRPDGFVARAVEAEDRRRFEEVLLVSADDELPMGLPVDGRGAVSPARTPQPQPAARVPGGGAPDRFFDPAPDQWPGSYSLAGQSDRSESAGKRSGKGLPEGSHKEDRSKGLPNLRFEVAEFKVAGRPVKVKASIRNKFLMFGARIKL